MKFIEASLNFDKCSEKSEIYVTGYAEIIKKNNNMLKLKIEFIRTFNCSTFNYLGVPCYKDPYKEARIEYYPATVILYSLNETIFDKFVFDEKRIIMDELASPVSNIEFDDIKIMLNKENVDIKVYPPIYNN